MDKLLSVLWAYHTTLQTTTGQTPFNMTFAIEAMILVEIGLLTLHTKNFEEGANLEQSRFSLCDLQEVNLTGVSLKKVGIDLKDLLKLELAPEQRADLSPWNYFVFNFEEEIIPEEAQTKGKVDEDGFMLLENLK